MLRIVVLQRFKTMRKHHKDKQRHRQSQWNEGRRIKQLLFREIDKNKEPKYQKIRKGRHCG